MPKPLLRLAHLSKTFPGVKALDDVSLHVTAGEIVAIVGHNGSGKSTLVKVLAGVYPADDGAIVEVRDGGGALLDKSALRDRLHFIHQDLGLIGTMSAVENLGLGKSGVRRSLASVRRRRDREHARATLARFGADFDPTKPVSTLTAAERAIVAIARATDGWATSDNVLMLDEPTTAFHQDEVRALFDAVRKLAAGGAGVVFVSHRLDEVLALADRVVALRDGCVVADRPSNHLDTDTLFHLIAGEAVSRTEKHSPATPAEPTLIVRGMRGAKVRDVSFHVCAGEVVGISGLLGSGREHIAGLVFGAHHREAGTVEVDGYPVAAADPVLAIHAGIGYVPSDRRVSGAVMEMNARENLTLPSM